MKVHIAIHNAKIHYLTKDGQNKNISRNANLQCLITNISTTLSHLQLKEPIVINFLATSCEILFHSFSSVVCSCAEDCGNFQRCLICDRYWYSVFYGSTWLLWCVFKNLCIHEYVTSCVVVLERIVESRRGETK